MKLTGAVILVSRGMKSCKRPRQLILIVRGLTMGYMSEFVRAPIRKAKDVGATGNPRARWDGIEGPPGLETMHLARL